MRNPPMVTDEAGRVLFADRLTAMTYARARYVLWHRRQRVTLVREQLVPGYPWHVSAEPYDQAVRRRIRESVAAVCRLARA